MRPAQALPIVSRLSTSEVLMDADKETPRGNETPVDVKCIKFYMTFKRRMAK